MYSNFVPSPEHLAALREIAGDMPVHVVQSEKAALELAPEAEIILGHRYLRQTLERAPNVRWVQSTAAGMEHIITPVLRQRRPLLARSSIASEAVALHAIAMAMALARRLPEHLRGPSGPRHERLEAYPPIPRRALILGLGAIGRAAARIFRCQGMKVTGVARSHSPDKAAACDRLIVDGGWQEALGETDILLMSLPLNDRTRGIINAEVVAALPDHAVVVNVSRGACIDWPAASAALLAGHLGGLAADATDELPAATDPIWQSPRFLQTPKVAALHAGFQVSTERYVASQLRRYFRAEPLLNVVDYLGGDDA
jgi:phosphoglycerate dehydrogenase-like enzyme